MYSFEDKHVIITGGLGFIGSNLARRLVQIGANVTLVDSLIPEYGGNLFNINGIDGRVRVNISDVRDTHSMRYLVQGMDVLFNLAGQTSHLDSMEEPFMDLDINSRAQLSILEACRKNNPDLKIVFASTRQVYGRPHYFPVDEDHPLQPIDVNGINKLSGEWYHLLYHDVYGIRTCVLRLTNTIGPRMRIKDARQTFLGIWIRRILEGDAFEVWGGEQLRDFTDVEDCIDALLLAAADDRANGQIYNLGGCAVVSLTDLAEMLVRVHPKSRYEVHQFPPNRKKIDIGSYYSDDRRIRKELQWAPVVGLEESLIRIVDFYQKHLGHYL